MTDVLMIQGPVPYPQQAVKELSRAGFTPTIVKSCRDALAYLQSHVNFLTIMDARAPFRDSASYLQHLGKKGCPLLFIAESAGSRDHLMAMYNGMADVLVCPYTAHMLIEAAIILLRRRNRQLSVGGMTVDIGEKTVALNGAKYPLTAQELALLTTLMKSPDTPLTREELLRVAWGYQNMGETRTVDVHVQRLRRKLGDDLIETVYKTGYRLRMA